MQLRLPLRTLGQVCVRQGFSACTKSLKEYQIVSFRLRVALLQTLSAPRNL